MSRWDVYRVSKRWPPTRALGEGLGRSLGRGLNPGWSLRSRSFQGGRNRCSRGYALCPVIPDLTPSIAVTNFIHPRVQRFRNLDPPHPFQSTPSPVPPRTPSTLGETNESLQLERLPLTQKLLVTLQDPDPVVPGGRPPSLHCRRRSGPRDAVNPIP